MKKLLDIIILLLLFALLCINRAKFLGNALFSKEAPTSSSQVETPPESTNEEAPVPPSAVITLEEAKELFPEATVLVLKDDAIYEELFETQAPSLDALTAADLIAESDSLSESFYLSSAASTVESTMAMAGNVDANFAAIFGLLEQRRDSIPPLTLPLKDMSYVQAGASVGEKQNPVYKLPMTHKGLDLIAAQGTDVFAAAGGTVSKVVRSRRGLGNVVEINHGNGYATRYCLLADIRVSGGQRIRRGQKVGTVGISSSYPTPHLHFEVIYKGEIKDPVNYLFASLSPEEYSRLVFMTTVTSQSLD